MSSFFRPCPVWLEQTQCFQVKPMNSGSYRPNSVSSFFLQLSIYLEHAQFLSIVLDCWDSWLLNKKVHEFHLFMKMAIANNHILLVCLCMNPVGDCSLRLDQFLQNAGCNAYLLLLSWVRYPGIALSPTVMYRNRLRHSSESNSLLYWGWMQASFWR